VTRVEGRGSGVEDRRELKPRDGVTRRRLWIDVSVNESVQLPYPAAE
jgi:hypothetical protein